MDLRTLLDHYYLTLLVWREARGEDDLVRAAVAYSVLQRVAHPRWWGHDIQTVATKKYQYSSLTSPRDPQLTKWPLSTDPSVVACHATVVAALEGTAPNPFPDADSYYDVSIPPPTWATPTTHRGSIGRLHFHRVRT